MQDGDHFVEGTRYLFPKTQCIFPETHYRRARPVVSGYRGQFHYANSDDIFDVLWLFPDHHKKWVYPGSFARVRIEFPPSRWEKKHKSRCKVGVNFEIRAGSQWVGVGQITDVDPPYIDVPVWDETWGSCYDENV